MFCDFKILYDACRINFHTTTGNADGLLQYVNIHTLDCFSFLSIPISVLSYNAQV